MKFFKTNFTAMAGKNKNKNILGAGTQQYFVDDIEFEKTINLLIFLEDEKTEIQLNKYAQINNISEDLLQKIKMHKLITSNKNIFHKQDSMTFKNNLYLESVLDNPSGAQKQLSDSTIVIIGCGGIGNFMSYSLQSFNPKNIILIDGDKIEESNLNRQLMFTENDIGSYKTSILARELKKRNSNLNITEINSYITEELLDNVLKNISDLDKTIGVLSGDSENAVLETTKSFAKNKVPFLNIGYLNDISVIGPFYIPEVSCCPLCHNKFSVQLNKNNEIESKVHEINSKKEAPSSFTNNALSSSLATSDILQYMGNDFSKIKSLNARFGIDSSTFKSYELKSSIDKNCKYCGNLS